MFRNRFYLFVCILALMAGVSDRCGSAEFTAERVYCEYLKTETNVHTAKLHVSGGNTRLDMGDLIIISRADRKVIWRIFPASKQYTEIKTHGETPFWIIDNREAEKDVKQRCARRRFLGYENAAGYECRKFEYQYPTMKPPSTGVIWYSEKLKCPVKSKFQLPHVCEVVQYKNIKQARLPGSLFEIPKGYKKVSKEPELPAPKATAPVQKDTSQQTKRA